MKKNLFAGFIFLFILFPFASLSSTNEQLNLADQKLQSRLQSFISEFESHAADYQGCAIAIVQCGNVFYQKTFGFQHARQGAITDNTLFPLASVSKPITATAVALLIKDGKLSLDDNVATILKLKTSKLTIKNILNHTTGYSLASNKEIENGVQRNILLEELQHVTPSQSAGEHFSYSNLLFSCIQEVILSKTKISWDTSIAQLWQKLNVQSYAICNVPKNAELASPHYLDKKTNKITNCGRIPRYYPQAVCSSAGLYASLKSMIAFLRLQQGYDPEILTKKQLALFQSPTTLAPYALAWPIKWPFQKNIKSFYGLGWHIFEKNNDPKHQSRLVFHGGYLQGAGNFIGFIPSHDMGIVILINQGTKFALQSGIDFWACLVEET